MHIQPTRTITLHPVPLGGRLDDLDEAAEWLGSAVQALKDGNVPEAVFACNAGAGFAREALGSLIDLLTSSEDAPPDALLGFAWPAADVPRIRE
jgi:hypothetical protein